MDPSHFDELVCLEDSYWWHVAKRDLVVSLLEKHCPPPGRLVEGGIGSARNLIEFRELGFDVTGYDVMPESVDHARARGLNNCRVHDLSRPWPLPADSARAVVLLDVLEHLADPVTVLKHVHAILERGGCAIVTVPAYPWLFGDWDRSLGHYRRYTSRALRADARKAGFNVEWINHWNAFTLPAAIAIRGVERLLPRERKPEFPRVRPAVNRMLLSAARAERQFLTRFRIPAGLSLAGVLKK